MVLYVCVLGAGCDLVEIISVRNTSPFYNIISLLEFAILVHIKLKSINGAVKLVLILKPSYVTNHHLEPNRYIGISICAINNT